MRRTKEKLLTIIGEGTQIEGNLTAGESLRLDGSFKGTLCTEGNLHIGRDGQVTGNVTGANVYISGSIKGDIEANGKVCILSGGHVEGDIKSSALTVDDNAYFQGNCVMNVENSFSEKLGAKNESYRGKREESALNVAQG